MSKTIRIAHMFKACQIGNTTRVEQLLKNGSDPNQSNDTFWETGWTPIRYAALSGFKWEPIKQRNHKAKQLVKMLLRYGANIDQQDDMGVTTLMSTVQFKDRADIVQMLIEYGADESKVDTFGRTYKDY